MAGTASQEPVALVSGAGGRLDEEVVTLLLLRGRPVIAGSRN